MPEFGPIFRALLRNKTGALLIALQIALTLAIMVNAVFMMQDRSSRMARPSGMDEANTFYLTNTIFGQNYANQAMLARDLDLLRKTPGVVAATQVNAVPLSGSGWSMQLATKAGADADAQGSAVYMVDEQGVAAFGAELIAGENFAPTDVMWREQSSTQWPAKVILTQQLAAKLFNDNWQQALGQTVYISDTQPMTVVGIIKNLQSPWHGWGNTEFAALVPQQLENRGALYLIRTEAGRRDALMPEVEHQLAQVDQQRIIRNVKSMQQTRQDSYRQHNATNNILLTVIIVLTLITGFGIVGLAMFSINRRVRAIGTRRALGASQWQIMRYFMAENLLISSTGVLIGALAAVGLNIWLVSTFSITPMGPGLLVTGVLALLLVGQLAVCYPSLIAARISPATATRGRA